MTSFDPRAQLAWLTAAILGALLGGDEGLISSALLAAAAIAHLRVVDASIRLFLMLTPLALMVILLDTLAGQFEVGFRAAARLLVVAQLGFAFARGAKGESMVSALRALHVPHTIVFVLVAGARFVPTVAADLGRLRDAARLRGIQLNGPPWKQIGGWRLLLVPLLVGTVRRGLQFGEALEARAFGASPHRTVRHQLAWRLRDTIAVIAAAAYLVLLIARSLPNS